MTQANLLTIDDILQQLGAETPVAQGLEQLQFPEQALLAAKQQWSDLWPQITALMQRMNADEELSDEEYQQLFYGVLLAADLADLNAAAAIFQWVDAPDGLGSDLEYTLGDALTEDLATMLYVLAAGQPDRLFALLQSNKAGDYVKAAALSALFAQLESLQNEGAPAASALLTQIDSQLDAIIASAEAQKQAFVLSEIAIWCMTFGLSRLAKKFQTLLRQNKLDTEFVSSREINRWHSETPLQGPLAAGLVRQQFDVMSVREWQAFQPHVDDEQLESELAAADLDGLEASELLDMARSRLQAVADKTLSADRITANTAPLATPKAAGVGRNDPCPCGSGKKFKKCCGA